MSGLLKWCWFSMRSTWRRSSLNLCEESINWCLCEQNGGHLAQPVSIYWFTTFGLYASAQPTTDGNLLADDVAHGRSHRVLWQLPPHRERRVTRESERYKQWDRALQTIYCIAIERRNKPGRKVFGVDGLRVARSRTTGTQGQRPVHGILAGFQQHAVHFASGAFHAYPRGANGLFPRSQPGLIRWFPTSTTGITWREFRTLSDLKKPEVIPPHFALPVLAVQSGGLVWDASHGTMRGIEHCVEDASAFYTCVF